MRKIFTDRMRKIVTDRMRKRILAWGGVNTRVSNLFVGLGLRDPWAGRHGDTGRLGAGTFLFG